MEDKMTLSIIARVQSDFKSKFGVPRQSGMTDNEAVIVFEPEFRDENTIRGISEYSHLWILWGFDRNRENGGKWSPTVKPPRLGGNIRMGVFATRSPYRPNPVGLSSVRLIRTEKTEKDGTVLIVSGADMTDGTPVYDIKPYLAYTDAHPDAKCGFPEEGLKHVLKVEFPDALMKKIPEDKRQTAVRMLELDPRPAYHDDPEMLYGVNFSGLDIRFRVSDKTLFVTEVVYADNPHVK